MDTGVETTQRNNNLVFERPPCLDSGRILTMGQVQWKKCRPLSLCSLLTLVCDLELGSKLSRFLICQNG
jgi:hypothetical protein